MDAFAEHMAAHLKEYLPESLADAQVSLSEEVGRNDQVRPRLLVGLPSGKDPIGWDTSELQRLLKLPDWTMERIMATIATVVADHLQEASDGAVPPYEAVRDCLYMSLCDAELNGRYLKDIPCTMLAGLAVTYGVWREAEGVTRADMRVTNEILDSWEGVTLEQLHRDAVRGENARNPVRLCASSDVRTLGWEDAPSILGERLEKHVRARREMYTLGTAHVEHGASVIAREGMLDRVARVMGGSFLVVPVNAHECRVVAESLCPNVRELADWLANMNSRLRYPQDMLSSDLFRYGKARRKLERMRNLGRWDLDRSLRAAPRTKWRS